MIESRDVSCLVFLNSFSVSAPVVFLLFGISSSAWIYFKLHADARSQNSYLLETAFSLILSIGKAVGTNKPFYGINNAIVPAFHVDGFGIT
jgi:hypothetical protein